MKSLRGKKLNKEFTIPELLKKVVKQIEAEGGTPIAVGGCVRDHLRGVHPKDLDIEVYGLDLRTLESLLGQLGSVHSVGRSFGVLKVAVSKGDEKETFDVSLPRTENKKGKGHKGFVVETSEKLSYEEASSRRDFTMNSMGINLVTQELLDPHGGQEDLRNGVLKHVSEAFKEDPLRVLRGCQFASRFNYKLHPDTLDLCRSLKEELKTLPKERIYMEMRKLFLGEKPSVGLEALKDTHAWELFEELVVLDGCEQEEEWHPEGDVWIHTKMVADAAAQIVRREKLDDEKSLLIVVAAVCHDLGKPSTTQVEEGRIRSRGHESAGEEPTRSLLFKMGFHEAFIDEVVPLVKEHLKPFQLYTKRDEISDGTIRRLARRVSIRKLCLVAEADFLGRTTKEALEGFDPATTWLRELSNSLDVAACAPEPILLGRHLIERGMAPSKSMGELLKEAFEAQLDGQFSDLEGALKWLDAKNNKSS